MRFRLIENYDYQTINKYTKLVENEFGLTTNYRLAGYLDIFGNLIKFSYDGYDRNIDHREVYNVIKDILPEQKGYTTGGPALVAFMNFGNIRLQHYGIDVSVEPNQYQYAKLRYILTDMGKRDSIDIDISDLDGYTEYSLTYPEGTSGDLIVEDLKYYFRNNELPNDDRMFEVN